MAKTTKINQNPLFFRVHHTMHYNSPKTLTLKGMVFSGKGEGAKFLCLSWVQSQIKEKLGFVPYSGTLNIELSENSIEGRKKLCNANTVEISPREGFYRAKCFKACLMDSLECVLVIPEIPDYPGNVIEVIAPQNLRRKLRLKDGDTVHVKICF